MPTVVDIMSPADQEGTQATVLRWLKRSGETVTAHEPLLELETDKVTVEVPAPASGRLVEVIKQERESVEPGAVLGRIDSAAAPAGDAGAAGGRTSHERSPRPGEAEGADLETGSMGRAAHLNALHSPAVKRLLAEHGLDAAAIPASGRGGRLTAQDITHYLEARSASRARSGADPADASSAALHSSARRGDAGVAAPPPGPVHGLAEGSVSSPASRLVPHTAIRRRIAAHMAASVATSPHVTTVFEADMSRVVAHRARHAADFEARGVKLTYTAYFVAAAVRALQAVPEVNSRFHEDALEIFGDCNIGVGTALGNEGLVVPVIQRAQTLDLFGIAQRLGPLVAAARAGTLAPEAVRGGTFTISNHGVSGSLLAAPIIIHQPQVAILGVGKLQRRVVVEEVDGVEALRVKPMCYLTLTLDHRALDAFQANAFLTAVTEILRSWDS